MGARRKIPARIQEQVRRRAQFVCEYCHTSELWQYVRFTVDHIIPVVTGGDDQLDNLCLACFHCNRRKSAALGAADPLTGADVPFFHPRHQRWQEHFRWSDDQLLIIGLTAVGWATVQGLELNRERVLRIRAADLLVGRHPPRDDIAQAEGT